jgi:type I restriction enzyme S subunit
VISTKKAFTLERSALGKKFRVENNNLDVTALIQESGFEAVRLGDIARAHREERDRKATASSQFRYVQISDIDVAVGRIKSYRTFLGNEAPNNARRVMAEGDVLVSTRRPTRGAIAAVPPEFAGHVCTVFFTTLRVINREEVVPAYLALFLRTSLGRFQFQSLITETAYPVIGDEDVENVVVLLPDPPHQAEIAEAYSLAVDVFFNQINGAYASLVSARQAVETTMLGTHAETLAVPRFGLLEEVAVEEEEPEEPDDA